MSSTYTPNPLNNPASVTIPSDGDAINAASVNPALEGIFDAVAYTQAALATETTNRTNAVTAEATARAAADTAEATARAAADTAEATARVAGDAATLASAQAYALAHNARLTFTAYTATDTTGSITVPARVTAALVVGYGGGGGGGGGGDGAVATTQYAAGGGGGAGAFVSTRLVALTPGQTLDVTIGAGGGGGTNGNTATAGSSGGDSIVAVHGGAELCRFAGAQGGKGGASIVGTSSYLIIPGGLPTECYRPSTLLGSISEDRYAGTGPCCGGDGVTARTGMNPRKGATSLQAYAGGNAGTNGGASGSYQGGGSGGGGGGGAGGIGGDGGTGGDAGSTVFGNNGGSCAANSGAGGGGGGAGACHATAPGTGGVGGVGGSGKILIAWVYDT